MVFDRKEYWKQYRKKNKEKLKEYEHKYYERNKNRILKYSNEYYKKNKNRILKYTSKYRKKNKEKIKEWMYEYRKSPKGKIVIKNHINKRRLWKINRCDGSIKTISLIKLLKYQQYKCIYCGCNIEKSNHLDHIIPLSKGGIHSINNLQFLCPKCNLVKSKKLVFRNYG